ncbi:MAG: hypothetical protein AB7N91_27620 [Candidatus Tectimicrobiota bacterium]
MNEIGAQCAECLGPVSTVVQAQNGACLCQQCAEQFYRSCAGCGGLIPQDEALLRDGVCCCMQCLASRTSHKAAGALSDAELSALVEEFIRLHAEAKHLNDRLDAIKEQLKQYAASQPRSANAVTLRAGEHTVKCGYSVRVSYHADKLAAVEALLGTEHFAALFARKITFSPVKASLDAFLASEAADTAAARAAILAAAERTEIATVTPVTTRRKTGTAGTPLAPPTARPEP